MKKILFINHSASRTGAPIMLLHFLKWLKHNKEIKFDVLSLDNGELLTDFTSTSDAHFFNKKNKNLLNKAIIYLRNRKYPPNSSRLQFPERALKSIAKNDYSLIYANSILSIPEGCFIKNNSKEKTKLIVHVHELNMIINEFCPKLEMYREYIDFTIAASQKVKDNLVDNWGFKGDFIKVIYEHSKSVDFVSKATDKFIVGASGLVNWRKGPDFFILVAQYVFKKLPDAKIKFQWVGRISNLNRLIYEEDLKRLNLMEKVEFTGAKDNPHDYFSNFDVFLMTSKEDPFPLVCIEVGLMEKPIICFEGATGTEEVLKTVDGTIVPYLDIEKMGELVIHYYNNEALKLRTGKIIKNIFEEFTPEKQSIKIYEVIKNVIKNSQI